MRTIKHKRGDGLVVMYSYSLVDLCPYAQFYIHTTLLHSCTVKNVHQTLDYSRYIGLHPQQGELIVSRGTYIQPLLFFPQCKLSKFPLISTMHDDSTNIGHIIKMLHYQQKSLISIGCTLFFLELSPVHNIYIIMNTKNRCLP